MTGQAMTWTCAIAILTGLCTTDPLRADSPDDIFVQQMFRFEQLGPTTPLHELLPIPPKRSPPLVPLADDLTKVPEVFFQDPLSQPSSPVKKNERVNRDINLSQSKVDRLRKKFGKDLSEKEIRAKLEEEAKELATAQERIAYQIFRINHLNKKSRDHFMEVLCENRPDLAGLPFVLGEARRLTDWQHKQLSAAVLLVQASLGPPQEDPKNFWRAFEEARREQREYAKIEDAIADSERFVVPEDQYCVAALTQILAVESAELQLSLVTNLRQFDMFIAGEKAVTLALAKLAVFSQEQAIRQAAVEMLKQRDTRPATGILLHGLRYPLPRIAQSAAEAVVQLQRNDLVPELVKLLEEPDPLAPKVVDTNGTKVPVVRELVRINHMRNCLLCHPPLASPDEDRQASNAQSGSKALRKSTDRRFSVDVLDVEELAGTIPAPGHELPPPSEGSNGYGFSMHDVQVRADITYLRQDFSLMQHVADAAPWPEMQRFDFLVRTRLVDVDEAKLIRDALSKQPSPYRELALHALRRMTGRDAGATAEAWRRALFSN